MHRNSGERQGARGAFPVKGVILAAGKGTRLYPVTKVIPKPILPVANRMGLEYAFDQLKGCGIHDICIVVGDSEAEIRQALGDGAAFGVSLSYVRQENPKGLAHAVGCAKEFVGNDSFMLYLGDAIYELGFDHLVEKFNATGCANLNLVKPVEDPRRFGVASVTGERIVKLVEKPAKPESNLAMAGMYIFGPQIWSVLPDLKPSKRGEYEITDAIQLLIDRGELVLAGVYHGAWFDTGTLDSFLAASAFLTKGARLIGDGTTVDAELGTHVVVGDGARFVCAKAENVVVLPGADVRVNGDVRDCILGGAIEWDGDLSGAIRFGDEE